MHYNPFHYIRSEKDILKLVNTIIANTKGEGEKSSEDFWVKAERLLYCWTDPAGMEQRHLQHDPEPVEFSDPSDRRHDHHYHHVL